MTHSLGDGMTSQEVDRLRDLRATTMVRLQGDRIHREYVDGTLDDTTRSAIDSELRELTRLGADIARHHTARVVATVVGRLADALDADDHVAGQREVSTGATTMAATAILSGWEVGSLSPF